jgi:transcriptional regulator with XRE-family HTH domain
MGGGSTTLTGGQGSRTSGLVSGFVLKLARESTGLTQEEFAEKLAVGVHTVQGWESGRRPLSAINAGELLSYCARLTRLGAPASTRRHLLEAIEADQILSTGISAGSDWVEPDRHPLANGVHRWTITNLITWPILGKMPQHLGEFAGKARRRGPSPAQPLLGAEERVRFFDHLRTVIERAREENAALLRRQAVYLLAFDGRPQIADWLRAEWNRAGRSRLRQEDLTGLMEARSASVALAYTGDSTHLHDFVSHMTGDRAEIANLNYWAYWIGELSDRQATDHFMLDADTHTWTGARLLQHLMRRLEPASPHLALNLSTLHSLIASRPALLSAPTKIRISLGEALDGLSSAENLSRISRDQLAGLQYAVRIANR